MVGDMARMTSDETIAYIKRVKEGYGPRSASEARIEAARMAQMYTAAQVTLGQQYGKTEAERQLAEQLYQQRMSPAESDRLLREMLVKARDYIKPEGVKVSTVDAQLAKKLQERRDEREVTARLALVDAYGEDVYPNGTVITFEKVHTGGGISYTYAVLKATDKWYATGSYGSAAIHTWDSLVEFLVSGSKPVKTFIVKAEGGVQVPATAKATATVNQS